MAEEIRDPINYKYEKLVDTEIKPYFRKNRRGKNRDENLDKSIRNSMMVNVSEEQIIDDILNRDLEQMMLQSQLEYVEQLQKAHEKEKEEERIRSEKIKENLEKFSNIRSQLKRVGRLDKDIQKLSDIIEPIIDVYCEDNTKKFEFDKDTYEFIMKNLKTIRLKSIELELIQGIIWTSDVL
jgi:hypothetical protein